MLRVRVSGVTLSKRCLITKRTGHRAYSSKVRAFPFVISKDDAVERLSFWTSMTSGSKLPGTALRRILPSLNIDGLRPTRIQAAYLPTWVVDAQYECMVWSKRESNSAVTNKDLTQVQFAHSNMPGFSFDPLSTMSFFVPGLLDVTTVPWSEDLRKLNGEDVLCLPFSLSPFKISEAVRSLSMTDATVSKIFRFDPSTVEETMMAAYPVLVPVYLAQFTVLDLVADDIQEVSVTSVMDAGYGEPRIILEVVEGVRSMLQTFNLATSSNHIVRGRYAGASASFASVQGVFSPNVTLNHHRHIKLWLDRAVHRGKCISKYYERYFGKTEKETESAVNWEDVRIRPFDKEERTQNLAWLASLAELAYIKAAPSAYISAQRAEGKDMDFDKEEVQWLVAETKKKVEAFENEKAETKPAWLAEYELQQRLSAAHPAVPPIAAATEKKESH